uniref:Uncharacterized protein n=1 Tax=Avena sativa TaxID=4498 RepID=A0ACD5XC32_AVESA
MEKQVPRVSAMAEPPMWMSKDRFAAKRLRTLADKLVADKRNKIEKKSAFGALLNVSPFIIPNKLIDFIATNTTPALREFKFNNNKIVFSKDMVRKVYGIRCGNRPVLRLKKSERHELRKVYNMEDPTRTAEFAWDEHLLQLDMDLVQNIQNHKVMPLKLPEEKEPKKGAKQCVQKNAKKGAKHAAVEGDEEGDEKGAKAPKFEFWITGPYSMLGMDHLQFPPNSHVFDYSLPRVCHVTSSDFKFVVKTDIERKILNNTTVFRRHPFLQISATPYEVEPPIIEAVGAAEGNLFASLNEWLVFPSSQELEVPARFKHLYDKHKAIYGADIDMAVKNFAVGLKQMNAHRMASLLLDVDAAQNSQDDPSVMFPIEDAPEKEPNGNAEMRSEFDMGSEEQGIEKEGGVLEAEAKGDMEHVDYRSTDEETDDDDEVNLAAKFRVLKHARTTTQDVPQTAIIVDLLTPGGDVGGLPAVNSPVSSPYQSSPPHGISIEAWNAAPDAPSFELFSQEDNIMEKPAEAVLTEQAKEMDDANVAPVSPKAFKDAQSKSPNSSEEPTNIALSPKASEDKTNAKEMDDANVAPVSPKAFKDAQSKSPNSSEEPTNIALSPKASEDKTNVALSPKASEEAKSVEVLNKPATPTNRMSTYDVTKDDSIGARTLEKKNRFKRAAKEVLSPPKMKKIKVSQDMIHTYDKFVMNGRRFKRAKKHAPKCFVKYGRFYTSYRGFQESLRPRQYLSSEVMNVFLEKFNNVAKAYADKNTRAKKKYSFSTYDTDKLVAEPSIFNPNGFMKDFKEACSKFKILKDDLFTNFVRTATESEICNVDFASFKHITPSHSQQQTLYDCGFYNILYMEHYNAKIMPEIDNDSVLDFRKFLASILIDGRENHNDDVEKIMAGELIGN